MEPNNQEHKPAAEKGDAQTETSKEAVEARNTARLPATTKNNDAPMMTLHDRSRHDVVAETSHAGRMIMERFLTRYEDRIAGQRTERRGGAQDHVK